MTVLVTGAFGFVGEHMGAAFPFAPLPREIDLADKAALSKHINALRPRHVVHLAAQSSVPTSFSDPDETYRTNFHGTLNLLQALKASDFSGRFLFVGTGDVYGAVDPRNLPIRETEPLKPRNPYAVSKVAAEALCYQWSQTEGFEVVMVRPFNHIGPRQSERFVAANFAKQFAMMGLGRQPPVLRVGNLHSTRDFTDVRDVVEAYRELLQRGTSGEIYNVCSGVERSILQVIQTLSEVTGIKVDIQQDRVLQRPAEQARSVGSAEKLRAHVSWAPSIPFEKTLADMVGDWRERLSGSML